MWETVSRKYVLQNGLFPLQYTLCHKRIFSLGPGLRAAPEARVGLRSWSGRIGRTVNARSILQKHLSVTAFREALRVKLVSQWTAYLEIGASGAPATCTTCVFGIREAWMQNACNSCS